MTYAKRFVLPTPPAAEGRRERSRRLVSVLAAAAVPVVMSLLTGTAPAASAAVGVGSVTSWGGYDLALRAPASLDATGATAIAAGDYHGLALTPRGRVVGWGIDEHGEADVPASLATKTVTAISAGGNHSLALTSDGHVTAWGENDAGQADVPSSLAHKTVTAIEAGSRHNLALTSDGHITAWGDGSEGATRVPASLNGKTVTAMSAGAQFSLALTSDGRITAWGWDLYGLTDVPASLAGKKVTAISAGDFYALALTSDGKVTAWGDNEYGQIRVPASLTGKRVTAISAGVFHSLALTSDGRVTAWGRDDYGETRIPPSLTGRTVTAVASGFSWSMVLTRAVAPVVTSSPASVAVSPGATVSLAAAATGSPTPTVQWQRAEPGGAFADVRGATAATYAFRSSTGDDGARFRAVFRNVAGSATTGATTLVVDRPPTAKDLDITAGFESATPVTLVGSDPDHDPLTYAVVLGPRHGTLSGRAPKLVYTPQAGYSGADSFTYRVADGHASSAVAKVAVTVGAKACVPAAPRRQLTVDAGQRDADGVLRSPRFTTRQPGELLLALVSLDRPARGAQSVTRVSGGGLTWTLVQRADTTGGSSEIWQAYATTTLRSTRVTARLSAPGSAVSMTVAGFGGAGPAVGRSAHAAGTRSAPHVSLTPQSSGSLVWGVGRVGGTRYHPTPTAGQKVVHDRTFKTPRSGHWVQRVTAASTARTEVVVGDRATAKTWGYTAVEIRGTCG